MKDSKERSEGVCRGYRFTMTAVMFGRGVDDAFSNLLDALELGPEDVLEDGIEAEGLDYVCVLNERIVGEA